MKKFVIDVKETFVVDGERIVSQSSHIVEASTDMEARISFAMRAFKNEKIMSVTEYVEEKKKK